MQWWSGFFSGKKAVLSHHKSQSDLFIASSYGNGRYTTVNKHSRHVQLSSGPQTRRGCNEANCSNTPKWTWHCLCNRVLYWISPSALCNQTFYFKNSTSLTVNLSLESFRLLCFLFCNCLVSLHHKSLKKEPLGRMAGRDFAQGHSWSISNERMYKCCVKTQA